MELSVTTALPVFLVLFAAAGGGLWQLGVRDATATFHGASYKEALSSGALEASVVHFPPIRFGYAETSLAEALRPPTWTSEAALDAAAIPVLYSEPALNAPHRHLLGTDSLGRDVLARVLWGARVSLSVGLVATAILVLLGVLVGSLAGYCGGWVDTVLSRLIEVVLCFPVFFLILVVVAFVGQSLLSIMVVIGLLGWTGVARLLRAELLKLRQVEFVVAARALGLPAWRVILRHLLPNALEPVLVAATFALAVGVLVESTLSYLGFGIAVPVPSWGALISESRSPDHWWLQLFPGLLVFLTVLSFNLVGDAVRDALDPDHVERPA